MTKGKYLSDLYKSIENKSFNVDEAIKFIVELISEANINWVPLIKANPSFEPSANGSSLNFVRISLILLIIFFWSVSHKIF